MSAKNYTKRILKKETITSDYLDEQRQVRIYLPPGYEDVQSYSIVYAQDGQDVFMFGRIATIANYLTLEKGMEPIIIVGVDVEKSLRTSEYYGLGERNEAYRRFFVEELVPFIEQTYKPKHNGLKRLLLGDSLGASVSLDIALDHPDLFQHIISLSGAFLQPSIRRLEKTTNLSWLHLWMLIGTKETAVKTRRGSFNILEWNRKAKDLMEYKQAQLTYLEKEGEHIWGFWQDNLPEALMHYFGSEHSL